jgi:hypothetical protein
MMPAQKQAGASGQRQPHRLNDHARDVVAFLQAELTIQRHISERLDHLLATARLVGLGIAQALRA